MDSWDDLQFFLAVARSGTVSGAAKALGVNHSTVSRRVNTYEVEKGVRLFERLSHGYEMTQAGENIYRLALEIEERSHAVERELFGRDARLQGPLCVTAYHGVADFLMPHLGDFISQYPDIDLEFIFTTAVRNLAAREADIAVRGTPKPPDHLVGRKIADFAWAVYTSANYQHRAKEQMLTESEVILWRDDPARPEWVQSHFPQARVALRVDDVVAMRQAVAAGLGVARLPCWVADMDPGLLRMELEIPASDWGWWILVHADLRATARVRVCRDFLIDTLMAYRDLIEGRESRYLPSGG